MTDDLITWLRAQLDEDERVARAARGERWEADGDFIFGAESADEIHFAGMPTVPGHAIQAYLLNNDPARVLREVEAKRRILDNALFGMNSVTGEEICRLLALPYADRPGYLEEWGS
jgi:hypothetical protein